MIITSLGEMFGAIKGKVVDFVVRRIKKMVPSYDIEDSVSFKAVLA